MSLPILHTPRTKKPRPRWKLAALAVVVLAALASVTAAQASTNIGQTGAPSDTAWYPGSYVISDGYVVPAGGGTIVSLNTQSGSCKIFFDPFFVNGTYNLQVLRPLGGSQYKVLGETGNKLDPCDGQPHSYPVDIPVRAGDVLGVYVASMWSGVFLGGRSSFGGAGSSAPAVGATISLLDRTDFSADESATFIPAGPDLALAQPSDVTVNARGSRGAYVPYDKPVASDEDFSTVTVSCLPASGPFAIGDTTVTCTATDTDGDANSPVTKTFTVHVKGAAGQLADLATAVKGIGPGTSLADHVASVQAYLAAGDTSDACNALDAFMHELNALPAKSIPPRTAGSLILSARQIAVVIGCAS
jgi:hypothetical protein